MAERDWQRRQTDRIQTCTYCGRSIMPDEVFLRDLKSGHLTAHEGCHDLHVMHQKEKANAAR